MMWHELTPNYRFWMPGSRKIYKAKGNMCMNNELICYAKKNVKMNLCDESKETKAFKEEYKLFLNILWDHMECRKKWSGSSGWGPYEDPDSLAGNKRINTKFYSDLCDFLNYSRKKYGCDKKTKYTYSESDKYIKNESTNVELVSDQFGFSAPSLKLSHPYDIYLEKCKKEGKNKDKAIDNVIKWVMESRTIGGSFLWPKDIWGDDKYGYNLARGGSIYRRSYIEDRVDLTLCEIKHYLNNLNTEKYDNDILYKYIKENSVGEKWIKSFGNFQGYVDYFCFNPFVDENYMPYDIVNSDIVNGDKKNIKDGKEEKSIFHLNIEELETMFNNINYMIIQRSNMMLERQGD